MSRILLTGASGFVGSHVAPRLSREHELFTVSRRREGDLEDGATLARISELAPDVVLHLAALTDAGACEREPERAHRRNVATTARLARAVLSTAKRFVYVSTDLVFDGSRGHYVENDPPGPLSVYGATKLEGEEAARAVLGRRVTAVRLALVYGPRRDSDSRPSFAERMLRTAARGETVALFTDEFRSPIYVEDAAESLARLAVLDEVPGTVHLGGPERCSRYDLGVAGLETFGLPVALARAVSVAEAAFHAPRPRDVSLDSSLAVRLGLGARGAREGMVVMRREMERAGFVVGS